MSRSWIVLAAAMSMTLSLGSIHAFSVFTPSFELLYSTSRAGVSAIYSIALVSLTLAVFAGHWLYPKCAPAVFATLVCLAAAVGLLIAANAQSWWLLLLGYGVVFGAANGMGYGYNLQLAALALPARKGLAMGLVTAVYAVGATVFANFFSMWIDSHGAPAALQRMAVVMVVVACVCGLLLVVSKTRYHALTTRAPASDPGHSRAVGFLWGGYGLGAAAGLMAIGHATGIAKASGALPAQLVLGVMLIGIGNALGGVFAGLLADRYSPLKMISTIPIISAASLGLLLLSSVAAITLVALAICGFAYGALIAAYPITVSEFAGKHDAARIYGRVFTAWGLSGLLAPWIAGVLFDWQSDYRFALGIATATAIASCWLATRAAILIRSK